MDKRKRDSDESSSSHVLENDRAKRVDIEGSSNAVASTREKDDQRIIRRIGPYVSYQPLIEEDQWEDITGRNIPLNSQTLAYHTSGWKGFVDTMAKNIKDGRSDMYDSYRELFVACTRIFRCSPISLFSPLHGLSCDAPLSDQTPNNDTESLWSQTSVRQLTQILTHPVFRGNLSHLRTVFQHAIIMRTDDRRVWEAAICTPAGGGLLAELLLRIGSTYKRAVGIPERPIRDIQRKICRRIAGTESSGLADVMSSLEFLVEHPATSTPGTLYHLGVPVYHVTATDINNIQLAIVNSNWDGTPRFLSTNQCYKLFMQRPDKPEGGPDFDQLADFYCRAWHDEQQRVTRRISSKR